jgi:tetratricopeptide (TPR) repeat protein
VGGISHSPFLFRLISSRQDPLIGLASLLKSPGERRQRLIWPAIGFAGLGAAAAVWWGLHGVEWQAGRATLPDLERQAQSERAPEPVQYHLGRRLVEAGRLSEGYAGFANAARAYPSSFRSRGGVVEALLALQRWDDAERWLDAWPPSRAQDLEPSVLRARLYLDGRHQPERARDLLRPLVRRFPSQSEPHYLLGRAHAALYETKSSLQAFQHAVRLQPQHFEYHRELAQAYLYNGQAPEALRELRIASGMAPDDAMTLYLLGRVQASTAQRPEDLAAGRDSLLRAAALRPQDAEIQCELGQAAQASRDFREAAARYQRCLELDPSHSDAIYRWAQCAFRLGDQKQGQRLLAVHKQVQPLARRDVHVFAAGLTELAPERWPAIAARYDRGGFPDLARMARDRAPPARVPDEAPGSASYSARAATSGP